MRFPVAGRRCLRARAEISSQFWASRRPTAKARGGRWVGPSNRRATHAGGMARRRKREVIFARALSCIVAIVWAVAMVGVSPWTAQAQSLDPAEQIRGEALQPQTANPDRDIQDEVFYFVMLDRFANARRDNDRGGLAGDKYTHGYDPTDKAFYHGGDVAGLHGKLDYLQNMGITAVWMTPIFKNKAVQGDGAYNASAGYHGYWITDFTQIDPHYGSNEELRAFIDAAHRRGIKVFFDIITNHTADVVQYRECYGTGAACEYRNITDYPYTTQGDQYGAPINQGFAGDHVQTRRNFNKLTRMDYAYTPFIPEGEENVKVPAWLNDIRYYHHRGDSTFTGENSLYGDFVGLDDLYTENPDVLRGMIDIYKYWIREFRIDGFRIDTVKHVNMEFWQTFAPEIERYARRQGIRNFFAFAEVYDTRPEFLSTFTSTGKLQGVLDFGFQAAAQGFAASNGSPKQLEGFFAQDDYYTDRDSTVYEQPVFIGNHDMGRIGTFIRQGGQGESEQTLLDRSILAHAMMFFARGVPVVYYGDEQGFVGDGNDRDAREDMFPSVTASYNDNDHLGSDVSPAEDNFDPSHPLYRAIRSFADVYGAHVTLRKGIQRHRYADDGAGIYALSRIHRKKRSEYLVAFNNDVVPRSAEVPVAMSGSYDLVIASGDVATHLIANDARLALTVPATGYAVYKARKRIPRTRRAPGVSFVLDQGTVLRRDRFIEVSLDSDPQVVSVVFEAQVDGGRWKRMGTDYSPPYRVPFRIGEMGDGTEVNFRVRAYDRRRHSSVATLSTRVDTRLPRVVIDYENGHGRTAVSGAFDSGEVVLAQPLDDNTAVFDWPEGASSVTLLYESARADGLFDLDAAHSLQLEADILPFASEIGGELVSEISLNNAGIAGGPLGGPTPAVLNLVGDPLSNTLYVRGGLNGWSTNDPLAAMGRGTYYRQVYMPADTIEFKFADASWGIYNLGRPVTRDGLTGGSNPGNLSTRASVASAGQYDVHVFVTEVAGEQRFYYRFASSPALP